MKVSIFLLICFSYQVYASFFTNLAGYVAPSCITKSQLDNATATLCAQKDNKALWQQVIDCHYPISEDFMRNSGEAQCPSPKYVEDPTDYSYSLQDVFLNICGFVEGDNTQKLSGGACLIGGSWIPWVDGHIHEVYSVRSNWGDDVPCNIGLCTLGLGLGVGA
jgi:hypothetical protein